MLACWLGADLIKLGLWFKISLYVILKYGATDCLGGKCKLVVDMDW